MHQNTDEQAIRCMIRHSIPRAHVGSVARQIIESGGKQPNTLRMQPTGPNAHQIATINALADRKIWLMRRCGMG